MWQPNEDDNLMKLSDLKKWTNYWEQLQAALLEPKVDKQLLEASLSEARAKMPVPVLWLLGKTQSGKTSIIKALTGSETAEIGNGFQPCFINIMLFIFIFPHE